jgi:hypothetical protein
MLRSVSVIARDFPGQVRVVVKIGAQIMRHGRYVVFQLAEVAVPCALFAAILRRIERLRGPPVAATPWGPDKITDDGREQLRALGFNV